MISKHSSFIFFTESEVEARRWIQAVRAYTLDNPHAPPDEHDGPRVSESAGKLAMLGRGLHPAMAGAT